MKLRHAPFSIFVVAAAALMLGGGCGPSLPAQITGVVTLDGKPIDRGTVAFHPTAAGPIAAAAIDTTGSYRLKTGQGVGLPIGSYRVTVSALTAAPPSEKLDDAALEKLYLTPRRYADPSTSGLTCEVADGERLFDIPLSSK